MFKSQKLTIKPCSDLFKLVWPYKLYMAIGLLALVLGSLINLLIPELIKKIIDGEFGNIILETPTKLAGWLILLFTAQAIFFYLRSYYFYALGQKVAHFLRQQAFRNILNRTTDFFDTHRTADLTTRIINDVQIVQDAISIRLSVILRYFFQVVVGIGLMCLISLQLSLLLAVILPLLVFVAFFLARQLKRASRVLQDATGRTAVVAEEHFNNIKLVKAFGHETLVQSKFNTVNQQLLKTGLTRSTISAFFSSFVSLLMNIAIIVVLLVGITLTNQDELGYGDLTAFLLYGGIVAISFSFIVSSFGELLHGFGALDRILELDQAGNLLQEQTEAEQEQSAELVIASTNGHLTFKDVHFSYPQRKSANILKGVSFSLPANSSTALMGDSGAGKSTIAMLALGLYQPDAGTILFANHDLNSINQKWYHSQTAYVPQDPALFATSIKENILFGNPNASTAELEEACQLAKVWNFSEKLPEGLNTICGERGHQLSGGERQRVAIARALIRKPLLLVMDEPTSALDAASEEAIKSVIDQVKQHCTILVIAHRKTTVQNVDQLLILNNGHIEQSADHTQKLTAVEIR